MAGLKKAGASLARHGKIVRPDPAQRARWPVWVKKSGVGFLGVGAAPARS
jgi:hypothetical protein